jgi:hypothetical protein
MERLVYDGSFSFETLFYFNAVRGGFMSFRRIISLTALLSFLLVLLTSVILYIVPAGRVAYWADWRLWGLSKEQWGGLHINLGVLFLCALLLHIYYNWSALVLYLKNKDRKLTLFTAEFNAACLFTVLFCVGTLVAVPPFSSILAFSDSIKDDAAAFYGEPPYGHAELSSLSTLSKRVGLDVDDVVARLKEKNIAISSQSDSIGNIAKSAGMSPQQLFVLMQPEGGIRMAQDMPVTPPAGTGNKTLADVCQSYNLNMKVVVHDLKTAGIDASPEQKMKDIAIKSSIAAADLYEAIRQSSLKQ